MRWAEYPLSRLTERFISGGTPTTKIEEYWQGDIPWITGADFLDGEVTIGRRYINKAAVNNSATNIVPKGSILMVTRTGVGKIAIAPTDIAISQDITGIVPKSGLSAKYILSAIRNKMAIILAAQRGATIKGVTRKDIEILPIPLAPLSEQRRIVEILDQADALRKKRAEADAKAARILPALFYKMFGDPLANPHGLPMETVGSLLTLLRNGTTAEQNQDGHGYPVTRIETISAGVINRDRVRYVDFDDSELNKWRLEPGDILFSHINSESHIGKTAIYKGQPDPLIHGMNLLLMRPDARQVKPEYLFAVLNTDSVRVAYRQRCKRAVNQASLNQKDISSLEVTVPSIDDQDRFCLFAGNLLQQVEAQKKATEKVEKLFDNLIHRAFTSDLTAKWREAHMKELLQEMEQQAKSLNLRMES
jgi:type I restriction enzyme S subunit